METFEESRATYGRAFELAGINQLYPSLPGFALPAMETGPRAAGSTSLQPGYAPPALLKAIAWIEAGWAQADYSVPYGSFGPTLVSHDCGYGLMQVTTGMQNVTGIPSVNQAMIGGHFAFNIARGAQILIDKWNTAPEYRPIVGGRNPGLLEDWYYAVWSYNGFSFKNHPLNPAYPANRVPYSCGPSNDGFGHNRGHYPYQELVFGCMARPPVIGGVPLWTPQPVNLATPGNPAFAAPLSIASWDACAYNLQCGAMDMATPIPRNQDATPLTASRSEVLGNPVAVVSATNMRLAVVPPNASTTTTLAIGNAGSGLLAWRITSTAPWLQVSRHEGATKNGTSSGVTIAAHAAGLPFGSHTASLVVESPGSGNASITISVTVDHLADGGLFRGSNPVVYLVVGGVRRHVPDPLTFAALGLHWANVRTVPDATLAQMPVGNPLLSAAGDGTLLKGLGPEIYVMQGGHRRHVAHPAAFTTCGYGLDAINPIPGPTLNSVPLGAPVFGNPCPRPLFVDGTLVRGSGPQVYTMVNGVRRHILDSLTMDVRRMRVGDINRLADSTLSHIETGTHLLSARTTGTLLRGTSPIIYVIDGGVKRHVSGPDVMTACGYDWGAIQWATDPAIHAIPSGPPLAAEPCVRFNPADGLMLAGTNPHVYLIRGGLRRHVPNPATFAALALKNENVDKVHDSLLAAIPLGATSPSILNDGYLLRGSASVIYVMQNGVRRHIAGPAVMAACGYNWLTIVTLPDAVLTPVQIGPPLTGAPCPRLSFPQGTLLQRSDSAVFVSDGSLRRHVTSPTTFVACGYKLGNIDRIPDAILSSIPGGPGVLTPPCP